MSMPSIEERFRKAAQRSAERSLKASSSFRSVIPILHDDVPTFIEAPHDEDLANSDVVVCGFPYEGIRARDTRTMIEPGVPLENTVYARDGAWEAPDAIRRHSLHYSLVHGPGIHHYEIDPEFRLAENISISDAGDLPVDLAMPTEAMLHDASDRLGAVIGADRIPILLGGDDITPYVGLRAVARQRQARIAVIKFDAHFDLCWEPRYWAGSEWCAVDGGRVPATGGPRHHRHPRLSQSSVFGEVAGSSAYAIGRCRRSTRKVSWLVFGRRSTPSPARRTSSISRSTSDVMDPAFLPAQKYPEPGWLDGARSKSADCARPWRRGRRFAASTWPVWRRGTMSMDWAPSLPPRFAVEVIASHAYRRHAGA